MASQGVLTVQDTGLAPLENLARQYGLSLNRYSRDEALPGSFWGNPEAGIVGTNVYVSGDTPIHSFLHETCHIICMRPDLRSVHTGNAESDDLEEASVCYLQILLADELPAVGRKRIMADMDSWGYSFRLGSARQWFEEDADDARAWLLRYRIIDTRNRPLYTLRGTV